MKLRRIGATAAGLALAAGSGLLISAGSGSAATPPPPTPVSLNVTGLGSSACGPLPVNAALAFAPGTSLLFTSGLNLTAGQDLSLSVLSEAKTNPAQQPKTYPVPAAGVTIPFATAGTYDLTWTATALPLLGILSTTQTGKIVIDANAQKCVVAVQVPVPSVSVPIVPSAVNSVVNGAVGTVVSGVNGVTGPVNGAVGGTLGGVNGAVGGLTGALPGAGKPAAGVPAGGSDPGTIYKPTGPTVADRTVPKGYGNGSGAGSYLSSLNGQSINAPALGFAGSNGKSGTAGTSAVKSGGSPNTVDLAANRPRSALDALPSLVVLLAVLVLSAATALYARTFLLKPVRAAKA